MKKLNLWALLLGAALFIGFGATSLSADAKCGAGKCGDAKVKPACNCDEKCKDADKCDMGEKCITKGCAHDAKSMKCGSGKCGGEKKAVKSKCGTGKCGDAK